MKHAIRLCALVCAIVPALWAPASAAPPHPRATKLDPAQSEHVKAAEQAWTAAENEKSAPLQSGAWEAAAKAFAAVDGDAVDAKVKTEAARAAVLAWENALDLDRNVKLAAPGRDLDTSIRNNDPQPIPDREKALIAALDRYQGYVTDRSDHELPLVIFLEARTYERFNHFDQAIKGFRAVLDHHRDHEVAVYSANLLLDIYNRLARYDELVALADEIAKDTKLLAGQEDLRSLVTKIQRTAGRRKAELAEREARATHDFAKYVAAGHAYLDLYNADPKAQDGDELLYNAGVAFEEGREPGVALTMYSLIEKRYAKSRLAAKAIARSARLYGDLAMYDKAADKLEQYAKMYAGEKDAYDALSDAVYYRKALGDRDKAFADVNWLIRMFGAKVPAQAAAAMWSMTPMLESDPPRLLDHLRSYLRTYGNKGGADRVTIAYVMIGRVLWKQSCPVAGFDGLCVKSNETAPRACGKGTAHTLTAVPRNATKAKEATAAFHSAIVEFERSHTDDQVARYYYAQAKIALADATLETDIATKFPKLDFGSGEPSDQPKRETAMKAFNGWFSDKTHAAERAIREYEAILAIKDPAGAITAAERIAIATQDFASTLQTATPPANLLRSQLPKQALDAYCDAMTNAAEPLQERTRMAFSVCLQKSTELGWFDDSSRICERALERIKPDEFPAAKERRSEATNATPVIVLEPATTY